MPTKINKTAAIPIIILALGIIIRLLYVNYFGFENYTHDLPAHTQYIQFVAKNLSLPKADKGLEYPQQPLYYLAMGFFCKLIGDFLNSNDAILRILVWFSALFSIGALFFFYLLAKKITNLIWLQSFMVGVFAFTPAFVYQAGTIGNDPLLAFFAASAFFFLICYIQKEKTNYLVLAIILSVLAVFTKISGGILLIMILLTLICKYKKLHKKIILPAISVCLIGVLCLSFALYRAYIPSAQKFLFVESRAYQGQKIMPANPAYFLSFKVSDLLFKQDQNYSLYGDKNISQSFPTFLYRSFLFGEYSYYNIIKISPFVKILMQFIILLGLLIPFGIITNLFFVKEWNLVDYVSVFGFAINLASIILFLFCYPSVCNSDFRYFSPLFLGLLTLSAMGLYRFYKKIGKFKFVLPVLCFSFISFEFCWIATSIAVKIFIII